MTDPAGDSVRAWLVGREYDDRNLITLTYATTDGERVFTRQHAAATMRQRGIDATAAVDVDPADLDAVEDADDRERYAREATRMADDHDPDEAV
jgi:hypothetical protein